MRIAGLAFGSLLSAGIALGNTYTVTTTADSGPGSLRQAITDANGNGGPDTINFNITGSGVHTITPATPLPTITDAVTINGYSQPGSSANSHPPNQGTNAVILIEIDGQNLPPSGTCLAATAAVTIRGLVINRCANSAIRISTAGGNGSVVAGNFLGTDPAGATRPGAQYAGVDVEGTSGVVVGGTNPADRNLISGNDTAQVLLGDSGGPNAVIKGNLIGTNAAGTAAIQGSFNYALVYIRNRT